MPFLTDSLTIPPAGSLNSAGRSAETRQIAAAGSRSVVPLVYGEDRIGALVLNVLTSGGTLLVQCLWTFACDSINDVLLNEQAIPAGASATHYTGAQTTPDSALVAAFAAQGVAYTAALTGYAYSVLSMPVRSFDGALNVTARVRGAKLYDPRQDSTNGGSGLQRQGTASTWAWSTNPALALVDFLRNATYGAGNPNIDWPPVIAAANACDALVGGEKRRTVGVAFTAAADLGDIAETLRAYAGCFILPPNAAGAGLRLVPDENSASVATYSHASGDIASIEPLTLRDMGAVPTVVEVIYTDARLTPWRDDIATASLAGAGTTRPLRLSQVRLPGVQRYSQALREAIERLNKLTLNNLTTSIEVFDIGIRHDVGDIITVTHPIGLSAALMRVTAVSMPGPGRWRLALVRHDAAAYDSSVVAPPAATGTAGVMPPGPPVTVAGLSGTVSQGIITWAWAAAAERDWSETRLRLGGTDWASAAPLWAGRATGYLQRISAVGTYTLRARHALFDSQESAATASVSVTVAAGDLVQSEPGSPGQSQAYAELYQWASAAQPADPSSTSAWTWATGGHSSYTGGNGWSVTVPANPGTAGARLWVAVKAVIAAAGTVSTSVSWAGGFTIYAASQNGAQGPTGTGTAGGAGIKAATPTVFKWAASIPTISGTATYTWSAADQGFLPSTWTLQPGSGAPGQTLWGATVQLIDAAGSATTSIDWSTASITARGYAGTNGGVGQTGISARRAYTLTTATSLGGGSVTVSGINGLPGANTVFGSGLTWTAQPGVPTAGQTLYQSDGLYTPATDQVTFEAPYISSLKVGSLSSITSNTGNLTVTGNITVNSGRILGGSFTDYVWPAPGQTGFYLGPSGLLLGNANNGRYFQVEANGNIYAPGFQVVNGVTTLSQLIINPNGTLTGGGGGGVTIAGLGYNGDLNATADVSLVASAGIVLTGNTARQTTGTSWQEQVYSRDSYVGGAFASALISGSSGDMFGLNTDPLTDAGYASLDFALHTSTFPNLYAFENGVGYLIGAYAANDVLAVVYDGSNVRYLQNGNVLRTVSVASGIKFFFDSSFAGNSTLRNIRFGPLSSNNWASVGGANKPQDNATNGATLGTNVGGQITAGNINGLVAPGAIGGSYIGTLTSSNLTVTALSNTVNGNAGSGARVLILQNSIEIYGSNNQIRVRISA